VLQYLQRSFSESETMPKISFSQIAIVCCLIVGSGAAQAQITVNGGGSSAPAPYWRQALNCYGDYRDLQTRGASSTQSIAEFVPITVTTNMASLKHLSTMLTASIMTQAHCLLVLLIWGIKVLHQLAAPKLLAVL
jgi:hypothetical protein